MRNSNSQFSAQVAALTIFWRRVQGAAHQHRGKPYAAFREIVRLIMPYAWRRRAVHFVRSRGGLFTLRDWLQSLGTDSQVTPVSSPLQSGDFYHGITLLPHLPPREVKAILKQPVIEITPPGPDIICFSIIDWSFRFQRPQQLMAQFAARGQRVFYLSVSHFRSLHARPKYSVQPISHGGAGQRLENLYEVTLATRYPLDLFNNVISAKEAGDLLASLDELRQAYNINEAIGYVMIPSWTRVACAAQEQWGWRVIYDCMDEWENFPRVKADALALEKDLVQSCDLLVVTAQRLYEKWQPYQRPMTLARNAADYDFYGLRCQPNELLPDITHPVIGYFGALADWFDVELLAAVARLRPHYTFVLLGGVFDVNVAPLQALPNIKLLGQQPYETMPQYLYHFDACIIPFKLNPITEATDPVKLYEYLSGGKPVVSVRLPELEPYADYVYLADGAAEFAAQLDAALTEDSPQKAEQRRALARQHTWRQRTEMISAALSSIVPRASIVVVTYNNLALTKLCLESVLHNTAYANFEVIVVDNHSTDGTPAYLRELAARQSKLKIILNAVNAGFAKANNQGIAQAAGEYLVLLNNDTVVPPGWLTRLLRHLADAEVGLVGPLTNFVGNEAKLEVPYATWFEMEEFARQHTWAHKTLHADIQVLAMFCVAFRRAVFEQIGPLDERFGVGMFEDDDYSVRVRQAGLRVACAGDVFVHHFGQAAFGKLIESGAYNAIFDENRRYYESKWNVVWQPHRHAELNFEPHHYPALKPKPI